MELSPVATRPSARVPDYRGACLSNLVPAIGAALDGHEEAPEWLPDAAKEADQVVLMVLDGVGFHQLRDRPRVAPFLTSGLVGALDSVCPTTTAAALASITTGTPPALHGLVGYRMMLDGEVFNTLSWQRGGLDARESHRASEVIGAVPFEGLGTVVAIGRSDYAATGFSGAHLSTALMVGAPTPSSIAVAVRTRLAVGDRFVYAYYDGVDRVAHAAGLGEYYDAELAAADALVADVASNLLPGSVLLVVADHGQVEVGTNVSVPTSTVFEMTTLLSGEGRFRWFHAKHGASDDLFDALVESYGASCWVRRRDELVSDGWLGPSVSKVTRGRLGDVVVAPFEPMAILDPADVAESRIVTRHGSLTDDEIDVPLCVFGSRSSGS